MGTLKNGFAILPTSDDLRSIHVKPIAFGAAATTIKIDSRSGRGEVRCRRLNIDLWI
jgi:hypothetical protein